MPTSTEPRAGLPATAWAPALIWPRLIWSRRLSTHQAVTRAAFLIIGVAIALGMYAGSVWFLRLCYGVELVGPLLCRRLLEIVLTVLLSVLVLSNVVTALSSFFLSDDLELLFVAPIPPRSFFAARFLQQIWQSSTMVLAFGLPVLLAFATVAGTRQTYVALFSVLPPLLVMAAAAGSLVVLLLTTLLPANRVRSLVAGLFLIAFVVLYLAVRLIEPERLVNPDGFASLVSLLTSLSSTSSVALPSHWATVVIGSSFRDAPPTEGWLLMLAALWTGAGAAHVLSSFLFRRLHGPAFARMLEGRTVAQLPRLWARLLGKPLPADGPIRAPARRAPAVDWVRSLGLFAPPGPHREMLIKDAKLLLRDASQWSQLILLGALVFVYLYNFRHFRQIGEAGLVSELALYLIGLGLAGFVTTAVSVRFAFPLMSLEGRVLWLLRSAPLRPTQLLTGKLVASLPPLLLTAEALAIVSSLILGVPTRMVLFSAFVSALISLSVGGLAVGMGAMMPDYRADSAARVASSFGGLVCMSVAMGVGLLQVGLALYPAYILHSSRPFRWLPISLCLGGSILATLLAVLVPLRLGAGALERHEL